MVMPDPGALALIASAAVALLQFDFVQLVNNVPEVCENSGDKCSGGDMPVELADQNHQGSFQWRPQLQ